MDAGTKISMAAAPAANHSSNKLDSALVHGGSLHDALASTADEPAIKLGMIAKQVFADDNYGAGGKKQGSKKDARSASEKRVRRSRLPVLGFLATCTAATALAAAGTVTLTPATAFALFLLLLGGLFLVNHGVAGDGGDASLA